MKPSFISIFSLIIDHGTKSSIYIFANLSIYKVSAILFFNLIMSTSTTFDQICKCAKLMFGDVFAAGGNVQLPSSRRCKCDSEFVAKIKFA